MFHTQKKSEDCAWTPVVDEEPLKFSESVEHKAGSQLPRPQPSWKTTELQLQSGNSRFFGGRPSWKMTGPQLQSGTRVFYLVAGPAGKMTGLQLQSGNMLVAGPVGR